MPTGDGLLVRLRPPGGRVDAEQLATLADASEAFGNGIVELTGQARLQVRGLSPTTLPRFSSAVLRAGLAERDPRAEARRRVILLSGGDAGLAARIEAALITSDVSLAEKFDVAVGVDDEAPADIMLHDGRLWLAGAPLAASVPDPIAATLRLVRLLAGRRAQEFDPSLLYHAAGLTADAGIPANTAPPIGPGNCGVAIGIVFGSLGPDGLRALAGLGARYGNRTWHLTRSRAMHLGVVRDAEALTCDAAKHGFIVHADDARRRISACTGRPGCASAIGDARGEALGLLPSLAEGARIHVAGCAKACGRPKDTSVILCGDQHGFAASPP